MRVAAYITEYESKSTGGCEPRFGRLHSHVFPFVYRHVVRGDGRKAEKICELSCGVERSCPTVLVPSFDYNPSLPETPFLSPIQSCYLIKHEAINPQQHLYPNSNILKKKIISLQKSCMSKQPKSPRSTRSALCHQTPSLPKPTQNLGSLLDSELEIWGCRFKAGRARCKARSLRKAVALIMLRPRKLTIAIRSFPSFRVFPLVFL
ncbi:hypothetical protein V8E51_019971 [Hyaloscypha variabilis]